MVLGDQVGETDILGRLSDDGIQMIHLQFVDIAGTLKTVTLPAAEFPAVLEAGKWFDGSAIDAFARTAESDMFLWPDPTTYTRIPWKLRERVARVLCWVRAPGAAPFTGDPRAALARVVDDATRRGVAVSTSVELEFFLLPPEVTVLAATDNQYFGTSADRDETLLEEAVLLLREMGVPVVSHHHEVAPHQHEIEIEAGDPLATADAIVTVKYVLRILAPRHGLRVTFMPKPWQGVNGSGMHTHQRVRSVADDDGDDDYGLSGTARAYIAGQLMHGRGMCAPVAPTVNSYKRFVGGFEAPVYLSWARHNRSAFVRVPRNGEAAGAELRAPDSSCNPYIAFAAMLGCGLDGIERDLLLPPPVEETLYGFDSESLRRQSVGTMPRSLGESLAAMEGDAAVQTALGDDLHARFVELKTLEWQAYLEHVGPWETERYFDDGRG